MTPDQRTEMRIIMRDVANDHGLDEADLYVRDRSQDKALARAHGWAKCRAAGYPFQTIADLGGWDHKTIMQGIKRIGGAA